MSGLEETVRARLGDAENPLLLSVRSGARASMPGMMDTVLNLGLNSVTVEGLATSAGDERFAYDSYRRFVQMFGDVVLGVNRERFEDILGEYKDSRGLKEDRALGAEDWRAIVTAFKDHVRTATGAPFPEDPHRQLWAAIGAVFDSWSNPRAVTYRHLHGIPDSWGTAVTVQAMVFGNMGADSATGVAFTRDPSTGAPEFYGEFLIDAQGNRQRRALRRHLARERGADDLDRGAGRLENRSQRRRQGCGPAGSTLRRFPHLIAQKRRAKRQHDNNCRDRAQGSTGGPFPAAATRVARPFATAP